jgi:hypothetical protein
MGRHLEGLAAACQRRLAPTESAFRIRRRRLRGRIVGGWGCRETTRFVLDGMLLTGNRRSFIFREDHEYAFDN